MQCANYLICDSFPPSLFGRLRKMSRAARWLRSLWSGSKERKTCGGGEGFEKKRWSFKKCSRENLGIAAWHNSDVDCMEEQSRRAVAVAVATAAAANAAVAAARVAARVAAEAVRFGPHRRGGLARPAAVRIQAAFRGYLARRALGALRGMVKLQALVRGDLARKQAAIRALERRTDYSRQLPARISIPHRRQLRDGENCRSPAPAGKSTPKSRVVDSQSPKYMASTQSSAAKRWAQPRRRPLGEINAEVKADVGGGSVEALEFRRAVVGKLERTQSEHLQRK